MWVGGSCALVMWVVVVWEWSDRTWIEGAPVWMRMKNLQGADAPVGGWVVVGASGGGGKRQGLELLGWDWAAWSGTWVLGSWCGEEGTLH